MARQMTNKFREFSLDNAPIVKENERIFDSKKTQVEPTVAERAVAARAEVPEVLAEQTVSAASGSKEGPSAVPPAMEQAAEQPKTAEAPSWDKPKAKKSTSGIAINIPMEDYLELSRMKLEYGCTLKELALQAIHEFVERHRIG